MVIGTPLETWLFRLESNMLQYEIKAKGHANQV